VRRYNDNGVNIAIFDMNAERGKKIAQEQDDNVIFFDVNVTDEDSVQTAINATIKKFGALYICNNYAGIGNAIKTYDAKRDIPFPLDDYKKIIDVNLI